MALVDAAVAGACAPPCGPVVGVGAAAGGLSGAGGVNAVCPLTSGSRLTLVPLFTRERSKLTREERIALSKKRRDSGIGLSSDERPVGKVGMETWGPGGDVVQELKDVIWQVGERRRKMTEGGGDS